MTSEKSSDIGFVFLQLTNNNIHDNFLKTAKSFIDHNPYSHIIGFNSFSDKVNHHSVPLLHLSHAKFFCGNLVLFDLASVLLTQSFTNIHKRFLYVKDAPWITSPQTKYTEWLKLYSSNNLEIIVQDIHLYDIYSIAWKQPIGISENFNYEELKHIIL
jgi:hypothetical protein